MAQYTVVLENKAAGNSNPQYVFVSLTDPFWGANMWEIATPNNWIGTGRGEYKLTGWSSTTLELHDGDGNGAVRAALFEVHYPNDLIPKPGGAIVTGDGRYSGPYSNPFLRWSGRNIVPE